MVLFGGQTEIEAKKNGWMSVFRNANRDGKAMCMWRTMNDGMSDVGHVREVGFGDGGVILR